MAAAAVTTGPSARAANNTAAVAENWNLHTQATYIWQAQPALRSSPYQGDHSLTGAREKSYSFTRPSAPSRPTTPGRRCPA